MDTKTFGTPSQNVIIRSLIYVVNLRSAGAVYFHTDPTFVGCPMTVHFLASPLKIQL